MLFLISRLLLSGNPLDCVCENLWIKLRLQEEMDSPEVTCKDDTGMSWDFTVLTPPDCGNVKLFYHSRILIVLWLHGDQLKQRRGLYKWKSYVQPCVCVLLPVVPKVEVNPKTMTAMEGGNFRAVCSASGSPVPLILWNLEKLSTHYDVRRFTSAIPLNVGIRVCRSSSKIA